MTRHHLPDERTAAVIKIAIVEGYTHAGKQRTRTYDVYIRPGFCDDGRLGEVFVTVGKHGGMLQGFLDQWAIGVSWLLQMGAPLEAIVERFAFTKFQPAGTVWHDGERLFEAESLVDAVVRVLARKYLPKE